MIASLPMYDRPETRAAHNRLWALVRDNLRASDALAPEVLTRNDQLGDQWLHPDLCLSQTCSLPYRTKLHGKVSLVATPVHSLPCPPGHYYSVLVVRTNDPRTGFTDFDGAILAYNDANSQSGWAAPYALAESAGIAFGQTVQSGAHQASAKAVVDKTADLAALDAVTWDMIKRYDPWVADLKEIATTPPTPALLYIAALERDVDQTRDALANAIDRLSPADRTTLCLTGLTALSSDDYLALPTPDTPA
ncbi:phosphate/phosphite/phosphonate ABC transporter substrate-binding protein [Rhodobacteraceae bacterium]|nr:phosphate/phosphite/phosphonate ABC transporter substrate-binding protein [Paracoccaceae bacterium]